VAAVFRDADCEPPARTSRPGLLLAPFRPFGSPFFRGFVAPSNARTLAPHVDGAVVTKYSRASGTAA
jgi:hypothetical protein